jgi:hypothetical protein
MLHVRRLVATSIAVVIAAVFLNVSAGASASTPTIKPIDDTFSFTFRGVCSFPIRIRTHLTGTEIILTDREGNPTIDANHLFVYAVWKNPLSGKTVIESDHLDGVLLPDDAGFLELGLNFHLQLPSGPVVLIDAGRLVFDGDGNLLFEAGNHQFENGDFGALCAALS